MNIDTKKISSTANKNELALLYNIEKSRHNTFNYRVLKLIDVIIFFKKLINKYRMDFKIFVYLISNVKTCKLKHKILSPKCETYQGGKKQILVRLIKKKDCRNM